MYLLNKFGKGKQLSSYAEVYCESPSEKFFPNVFAC